ncbi:MAG: ABC transporter permease [Gemmatimonadota bacterium]|nr:MAG: ABC transporter permease [Gemmatimonadota bacterium]
MSGVWHDLRYGFRQLRKNPGFTLVAVISLALGIGANTAIFSVVNGVLLRPLPYGEPDRVVHILSLQQGQLVRRHTYLAYPEIEYMRNESASLSQISAFRSWTPILYGSGEPTRVDGSSVSAGFFRILGIQPALGRFFLPEEEELGHEPVVVLSYGFWQSMFGGDRGILGSTLDLDGVRYTVVGVAPAEFEDPFHEPLLWRSRPPYWDATRLARFNHSWRAIGKVAEGITLAQAQADLDRVWLNMVAEFPQDHTGEAVRLMSAKEWTVGAVRSAVLILLGAVGMVLLIACANVANLYLTRTVVRGREVALRAALGAGNGRLIRQLLTEVCLLFVVGGAAGLALAWVGMDSVLALGGANLPRISGIRIDWVVLGFALGISLLTGIIFGLTAAYQAVRSNLSAALQVGSRSSTGDRAGQRLRSGLVVAEIALSLVLLAGAGLLLKSFWNVNRVDPGFRAENVLTLNLAPRAGDYAEHGEVARLYEDILERVGSLPGVGVAGAINILPMTPGQNCEFVWPDDRPFPTRGDFVGYDGPTCAEVRVVSSDYFRAMGVSVVRGRGFTPQDDEAGAAVAIVNEAAAGVGFPGEESAWFQMGKRVTVYETRGWLANVSRELVGVVSDVRQVGLAAPPVPAIYVPHAQELDPERRRSMYLALRTERDPADLAESVRAAVWQVDENISISAVSSMEAVVSQTVAGPRFRTVLLLIFGAVALLLSAVGVAGVVGYAVSQRVPEIGLRVALGAQNRDIYSLVMGQGVQLTGLGLLLGLIGGLAATRVLSELLYELSSDDPVTFFLASLLMVAIALVAVWIPARKALRVNPVEALNAE